MGAWMNKLKSNRGASLFIAIVVFLVCSLVGMAALTAVSTSAGRYQYLEAEQQDYLAVSSAARLLEKQFRENTYKVSCRRTTTTTFNTVTHFTKEEYQFEWINNAGIAITDPNYKGAWETSAAGNPTLEALLGSDVWNLFLHYNIPSDWRTVTYKGGTVIPTALALPTEEEYKHAPVISLKDHDSVPDAKVSLALDASSARIGAISAKLWLEDGSDKRQPINLEIPVSWVVEKPAPITNTVVAGTENITTQIETITLTVKWERGTFSRGSFE